MEDVIRVGTSVDCSMVEDNITYPSARFMHNALGCRFIELFKFATKLNVTYINFDPRIVDDNAMWSLMKNGSIDIFARPVALRAALLESVYPIHALFAWRVGFILHREQKQKVLRKFYSKPFSGIVWLCLYWMTILATLMFLMHSRWERRLGNRGECSFVFELLLAIGAFCQHVFPVETTSVSRRTAYVTFFMFSYLVYSFYTSNLLSHLVSDKEDVMTLTELEQGSYNYMYLDGIKEYKAKISPANASGIMKKIKNIPVVSVSTGLEAVRRNKTALLSDYAIVHQEIIKNFSPKEICNLIEIDLFSKVQKYLVSSRTFRYKEIMKISTLRMQESGILQRLTATNTFTPLQCSLVMEVTTSLEQISGLLLILSFCYVATVLILICERLHCKRYRLYPYVN